MSQVALEIYSNQDTMYTYQILEESTAYRVWVSTGPLDGEFIGGEFEEFPDALEWLSDFIKDGEDV